MVVAQVLLATQPVIRLVGLGFGCLIGDVALDVRALAGSALKRTLDVDAKQLVDGGDDVVVDRLVRRGC